MVFGRAAGQHMIEYLTENPFPRPVPQPAVDRILDRLARWDRSGSEKVADVRTDMQKGMQAHCGVYRNAELLQQGIEKLTGVQSRLENAGLSDRSKLYNTARLEARNNFV